MQGMTDELKQLLVELRLAGHQFTDCSVLHRSFGTKHIEPVEVVQDTLTWKIYVRCQTYSHAHWAGFYEKRINKIEDLNEKI
jgi:hypothetical protein